MKRPASNNPFLDEAMGRASSQSFADIFDSLTTGAHAASKPPPPPARAPDGFKLYRVKLRTVVVELFLPTDLSMNEISQLHDVLLRIRGAQTNSQVTP